MTSDEEVEHGIGIDGKPVRGQLELPPAEDGPRIIAVDEPNPHIVAVDDAAEDTEDDEPDAPPDPAVDAEPEGVPEGDGDEGAPGEDQPADVTP